MNSAAHVDNDISNWKTMGMTKAEMVILIAEDCLEWPYVYGERGSYDTISLRSARANDLDKSMPAEAAEIRRQCQVLSHRAEKCDGCRWFPGGAKVRCFDCRGFTYWVMLQVGITIKGQGATSQWNDDSNWSAKGEIKDMPSGQICCVFMYNKKTGKMDHTGLHVGNGRIIHCSGEVKTGKITDKGWTHFAVPVGMEGDVPVPTTKPTLRKGATGPYVVECQEDLLKLGYDLSPYGADGKYGDTTIREVKKFQTANGLVADGICGQMTWAALDAAVKPDPTPKTDYYTVTIQHLTLYDVEALKARYDGAVTVTKED